MARRRHRANRKAIRRAIRREEAVRARHINWRYARSWVVSGVRRLPVRRGRTFIAECLYCFRHRQPCVTQEISETPVCADAKSCDIRRRALVRVWRRVENRRLNRLFKLTGRLSAGDAC